jgi:hypothetical protein
MFVRLVQRMTRGSRPFGVTPETKPKTMIAVYIIAAFALAVVGYLIRDFYNEQIRGLLVPVPVKKHASRRQHRH